MKRRFGLTLKFTLGIVFIGICITLAIAVVGVQLYQSSIKRHYNDMAYQTAETAVGYFTLEDLAAYADLTYRYNTGEADKQELARAEQSKRYQETKSLLDNLRQCMGANDIYVVTLDIDLYEEYSDIDSANYQGKSMYYIMDSYWIEEEQLSFGDSGGFQAKFRQDIVDSYYSGEHADRYFISESQFGYNITALYPVVEDGGTVAFVGVEIPMSTLRSDTSRFVLQVVVTAGIIAILILFFGISRLIRTIVRPIKLVASEAEHFLQNNNQVSETLCTIQTNDEIQELGQNLLQMEIGINKYIENLKIVTAEKERIGAELNVATQIQADMLPRIFPPFPDRSEIDIYATMDPAKEVGGDFYDFFLVDDDHLALVMADVSGKGVPAALFMVIAKTLIKNRAQMGGGPAQILHDVNDQLCEGNEAELFVTVWLAIIQISTGEGLAANAGHEHPALCRAGNGYELVKYRHSLALAAMEGMRFREHEFQLRPGDSLYVYTDGVPEATNAHEELYGTDRMLEALNQEPGASPEELLRTVKEEIDAFVGDAPQFDDITMLCLHYYGGKGREHE